MFFLVSKVILIIVFIYGIISLLNDLFMPKINGNFVCVMYVKNIEDKIEQYLRTIKYCKIQFKKILIIDLNSTDNTYDLLKMYEKNDDKIYILSKK